MNIAIVGAGGHAREVLDAISARGEQTVGFLVEPGFGDLGTLVHDLPILGGLDWIAGRPDTRVIVGVGAPEVRRRLARRASEYGARFGNVVHPTAVTSAWVTIGTGVFIGAGSILTNEIVLGDHVHINVACSVSHDTTLEQFVTLSPGVHVAGGVTVEQGAFLGVGATLMPRVQVGAWSRVGAGAVVTENVAPNTTVVGVPAKAVRSRPPGWHLAS